MADLLLSFDVAIQGADGRSYRAQACGRRMDDSERWEGWLEFIPEAGGTALRTQQESVQPHREALVYWATGLGEAYLEGALERALDAHPAGAAATAPARAAFAAPAAATPSDASDSAAPAPPRRPRAVLDPFHVYAQGEDLLRQELSALAPAHLRNILRAHDLVDETTIDLQEMNRQGLADLIVAAVRKRA